MHCRQNEIGERWAMRLSDSAYTQKQIKQSMKMNLSVKQKKMYLFILFHVDIWAQCAVIFFRDNEKARNHMYPRYIELIAIV